MELPKMAKYCSMGVRYQREFLSGFQNAADIRAGVPYLSEVTKIKNKTVKALKYYHNSKRTFNFDEKERIGESLRDCYRQLKRLLVHYIGEQEFLIVAQVYELLGEVSWYAHDYSRTIKYYTQAEIICSIYGRIDDQSHLLEKIGRCYIKLEEYQLALVAFKSQLKIGWIKLNRNTELAAYDNIGMAYYYLGNLEAAEYYHKRMANCASEPFDSAQRIFCISNEETMRGKAVQEHNNDTDVGSFNPALALTKNTQEDKDLLLRNQFRIATVGNETPRIVQNEPLRQVRLEDLPSPRMNEMLTAPILKNDKDKNQLLRKAETKAQETKRNRILMAKLKHLSKTKNTQSTPMNVYLAGKPSEETKKPKVYISHLSSLRLSTAYSRNEETRTLTNTCERINGFEFYLRSIYRTRAQTGNKKAFFMPRSCIGLDADECAGGQTDHEGECPKISRKTNYLHFN